MILRRLPLFSTLIVLIAVGIMIRLGFWQLDRLHQKEALLSRYGSAGGMSADVPWPRSEAEAEVLLYRRSAVDCAEVTSLTTIAGQNAEGGSGLAQIAECNLAGGGSARIVLGWSSAPDRPEWRGGRVTGVIAPGPRLVADPPLAGLKPNRLPDPTGIPNNHLAYAVQWFLFAGVALVIYVLAVRKRLAASAPRG
jgi:surfeit locus 1 family protein